ncbi:MAG TPA: anti-sigma factor antagonist [Bacteroidetes bacterium]|nr:anti-sigma factor antagonist [Bacteroidota bacterium]
MDVTITNAGDAIRAKLVGPIADSDASSLKEAFARLQQSNEKQVVIDLTYVPTITSSGIGKLISLYRKVNAQNREFRIEGIHESLKTLFESIHLDKLFKLA